MARKLIIDADPGCGDALAVALAMLDPEIDLIGLTAVAGRASGAQASRHLQGLVELIDPPKWPRIGCSEGRAVQFHQTGTDGVPRLIPTVDGPIDLGPLEFGVASLAHPRESDRLIIDLIRDDPQSITILTLGPMTNVHLAAERFPQFESMVKSVVSLAGAVAVPGDVTAVAEFNAAADPESARTLFASPITKTLVPLDLVRQVVLTFDRFRTLKYAPESPIGRVFDGIVPYALRSSHEGLGMEGMYVGAILALALVSRPSLFTTTPAAVAVESQGELTRGMTVVDRRDPLNWRANCEIATKVSSEAIFDYIQEVVSRGA